MQGEPYEDNNLENPQSSANHIRIEQAGWYLEGCLNALKASPGPGPGDEALMKTVRHAIELVRRRLCGEQFMHNEADCKPEKRHGADDVPSQCTKKADVDSRPAVAARMSGGRSRTNLARASLSGISCLNSNLRG
jgi:hypothetical protein